ncbi:hypothetical protein ZIOFF_023390 [Zingiber officinale]|uniref:Uncharacterized protein n=1 Tax=Zingiber officinale TaxID=94328 RepID=A0A8J5GS12_ZINOF|nr:hypothetical protein ZIOFF_023390 [Zingiber officinale]
MWNIFKYLEPRVCHFSRNTIKSDIKKIYGAEFGRLRTQLLAYPGRICLTSDAWTSIATDGYLSLTAHYVNKNWVLRKKNFEFFLYSSSTSRGLLWLKRFIVWLVIGLKLHEESSNQDLYMKKIADQIKDWLFGENDISPVKLEDVTQDIMALDLNNGEVESSLMEGANSNIG